MIATIPFRAVLRAACAATLLYASLAAAQAGPDVWMKLYNEKDLTGWKGRTGVWKVDTGGMVTGAMAISQNTFLVTDSLYDDFHLKVEGRMPGSGGYRNSGLIYRGKVLSATTYEMQGYQYELSNSGTGAFYHERGNEMGFVSPRGCTQGAANAWKKMEIIANGPKVTHLLGGASCFEHATFKVLEKGLIGLQLHSPGDFTVNFRNIFIKPLNNSFQIPADNAWDGNGNRIGVLGIDIRPRQARPRMAYALGAPAEGWDLNGRSVAGKRPALLIIAKP